MATAKKKIARPRPHRFVAVELNQIDSALRPAVGDSLTNKVIATLRPGTSAQEPR